MSQDTATKDIIANNSQAILNTVHSVLPVLEVFIPAVAGKTDQINLALSAANSLISLIHEIPSQSNISVEEQAKMLVRVYAILAGSPLGPEWQKQE